MRARIPSFARLLVSAVSTMALAGSACLPRDQIRTTTGTAEYNEKIRPDLQPLTAAQAAGPPWVEVDGRALYSDGGDGSALVSELYHSMVPRDRLLELRRSRCLFVEGDGFPILSYEVTISDLPVGDHDVNIDTVGLCGGYPNHPETRETLSVDSHPASFEVNLSPVSAALLTYGGNETQRNPYGACDEVLPSERFDLTQGADLVDGSEGSYRPFCLLGGAPPVFRLEDTSYQIDVVHEATGEEIESTLPGWSASPRTLLPHLKVVRGRRSIARPLDFEGSAFDAQRNRWVHTFSWSVDSVDANGATDPGGAFWRENFAPSVLVESAAFFVQLGSAPAPEGSPDRQYLAIDKLRVAEIGDVGPQEEFPVDAGCDLEQAGNPAGDGSIFLAPCEITATPTYALVPDVNGRMTQKLEWRVQFFTPGENDPIPVQPGDAFFVEFRLQAPESGSESGVILVDPGFAKAGDSLIGTTKRLTRALSIESAGSAAVMVDDIRIQGADAAAFRFELPAGTTLPFVLPAGRETFLDLLVETTRWGWHDAELVVSWSDAGQQQGVAVASLSAYGVAADLDVLPRAVSLRRGDAAPDPNAHVRNVLLLNTGNADLHRKAIVLDGANASLFTVVQSDCAGKVSTPPSASCAVPPGGMEILTVFYHPLAPGLHDARLALETSAGDDEVVVLGACEGTCFFPPPKKGWLEWQPEKKVQLEPDLPKLEEKPGFSKDPAPAKTSKPQPKLEQLAPKPVAPAKPSLKPAKPATKGFRFF